MILSMTATDCEEMIGTDDTSVKAADWETVDAAKWSRPAEIYDVSVSLKSSSNIERSDQVQLPTLTLGD